MLKKFLIWMIQKVLWVLDEDHRTQHEISDHDDKKFTHVVRHNFRSDFGTVKKAFRTVPYELWELKTDSRTLYAADKHLVVKADGKPTWMQDLNVGEYVKTLKGHEIVLSVRSLGIRTHMYDIEVNTKDQNDPNNHLYYANGVLSHNTTTAAAFLLWKAMFREDTQILIAANKFSQAMEIMDRIRYSYEECPNFIRAGVTEYNKGTITFDNGSRITARATTSDAGRGLSITLLYCLGGETSVTVRDKMTGEIKQVSLQELHAELT